MHSPLIATAISWAPAESSAWGTDQRPQPMVAAPQNSHLLILALTEKDDGNTVEYLSHHGALGLDSLTVTPCTLLFPGQPLAGNARQSPGHTSRCQAPGTSSWKNWGVRANLGALPRPLPENSSQGSALSHKERRRRSLTATHCAAFWGVTDGLLFTSLFQTLT